MIKIAYICTYPPRQCGIATFTNNLIKAINIHLKDKIISNNSFVVALDDENDKYAFPEEVKFRIRQEHQRDYINAAKSINFSDVDVCILEHEFGIFGGDDGVFILPLIHRLKIPLIATFHTVLKNPSFTQKAIIQEIGKQADRIVVMSNKAVSFLKDIYEIPQEKVVLIEHGVPNFNIGDKQKIRSQFGYEKRKVLFTFGLISPNKGIETVLHALPEVIKRHPEVLYIILGQTHPAVKRAYGEEYRNSLKKLIKNYDLENNVYFNNNFITEDDLIKYLLASDIYITPYLYEDQITSGTLSYAMGAGKAIISTPYWHAQELLSNGRGILFNFKDSHTLSREINDLLDNTEKMEQMSMRAYEYGKSLQWSVVGKRYLSLGRFLSENYNFIKEPISDYIDPSILPSFKLDHVLRLTDDTGIVQHAKYGIPNLKEGYCLDDNARALLMACMAYKQNKDKQALNLMPIYLSYIHYMQNDNGSFRNFLSFNRHFLDEVGSEDAFGRTIWALGFLIRYAPHESYRLMGKDIFYKSYQQFHQLTTLRGVANTIIGICHFVKIHSTDETMIKTLKLLTERLMNCYRDNSDNEWKWYEKSLTYDNGILPLAMLHAYGILRKEEIIDIAKESITFLEKNTFRNDYLSVIGNQGWYIKGHEPAIYDQQSIDVMASVLLYHQAYILLKDEKYLNKLFKSYLWFLGENELRIPLYDYETCGCCDGLEPTGINRNQGAESTLAYLISHLAVLSAFEAEHFKSSILWK